MSIIHIAGPRNNPSNRYDVVVYDAGTNRIFESAGVYTNRHQCPEGNFILSSAPASKIVYLQRDPNSLVSYRDLEAQIEKLRFSYPERRNVSGAWRDRQASLKFNGAQPAFR